MGPSFSLGRVRGVPITIHWSALLGALYFGGSSIGGAAAWLLVVLVHEGGHAVLARRFGRGVHGINVHAFGGECRWTPGPHRWAREIVAWGGVLGQLALCLAVLALAEAFPLTRILGRAPVSVLTKYNLYIAALNLLPIPGLDGSRAWRLFGALRWSNLRASFARLARPGGEARAFREKLDAIRSLDPAVRTRGLVSLASARQGSARRAAS
jgi:Zn-dependent protease